MNRHALHELKKESLEQKGEPVGNTLPWSLHKAVFAIAYVYTGYSCMKKSLILEKVQVPPHLFGGVIGLEKSNDAQGLVFEEELRATSEINPYIQLPFFGIEIHPVDILGKLDHKCLTEQLIGGEHTKQV